MHKPHKKVKDKPEKVVLKTRKTFLIFYADTKAS
jgi:hypothetical protein